MVSASRNRQTLPPLAPIAPQAGQAFDGISIVPALRGNTLDRKAIFTYFPHSPGIPDWLPPAVSVHRGDWKLIRLFHGGEDEQHRWKLFNLREDLGEQHDLASKFPERVQALDALIEAFLADTVAARVPTAAQVTKTIVKHFIWPPPL